MRALAVVLLALPLVASADPALHEVARHTFDDVELVGDLAFGAEDRRLLVSVERSLGGEGSCGLVEWTLGADGSTRSIGAPYDEVRVAISPDGTMLAVGVGNELALRELSTGKLVRKVRAAWRGQGAVFSSDGTHIASGDYAAESRGTVVSSTTDGKSSQRFRVFGTADTDTGFEVSLGFSADGTQLAVLAVNDVPTYVELEAWSLTPRPKRIRALSLAGVPASPRQDFHAAAASGRALAFVGNTIFAAFHGGVGAWDAKTGKLVHTYDYGGDVSALAVSRAGDLIAAAGSDHGVRVWSVQGALVAASPDQPGRSQAIAFSPDGKRLAVGVDKTAVVWQLP